MSFKRPSGKKALLKTVILPYQFIPFKERKNAPHYYTPYIKQIGGDSNQLPRHDQSKSNLISGTIEYEIEQHSPLVLELRQTWRDGKLSKNELFLSGSQIRGLVRTNAEILSHSFPEHVNKNDFYFRDFANPGAREHYKHLLGLKKSESNEPEKQINKIVRAGFLTKIGKKFYVVPAQPFDRGEYFKKIKEHQLRERFPDLDRKFLLFHWKDKQHRAVDYFELPRNECYMPYQYFNEKHQLYLYNSSATDSKNSHYLIKTPNYKELLEVPDELVNQYNKMLKNMKFPQLKKNNSMKKIYQEFYNLFEKDGEGDKHERDGRIVFYLTDGDKIVAIGRTPFLKIPTRYNVRTLLDTGENVDYGRLDFARALFGFAEEEVEEKIDTNVSAYKSRVRFEPVLVKGLCEKKPKKFLLPSPSATAEGMYLKQKTNVCRYKKIRYSNIGEANNSIEDQDKPNLRGFKYYLVRKKAVTNTINEGNKNQQINTEKYVYEEGLKMSGKIHFNHLTWDELGLLLLSVDIKHVFELDLKELSDIQKKTQLRLFELIGGAKAYGYGKVQINIKQLKLDPQETSFEALLGMKKVDDNQETIIKKAIEAFINKMKSDFNQHYLQSETFQHYLLSKMEYDQENKILEWTECKNGYEDHWVLENRQFPSF